MPVRIDCSVDVGVRDTVRSVFDDLPSIQAAASYQPPTEAPSAEGMTFSPVHWSRDQAERMENGNGCHLDIFGPGGVKIDHVPFVGQTTLPTFRIGGGPSYENDAQLKALGGGPVSRDVDALLARIRGYDID